ncbi:hypothetical protein GCM10010112_39360 [Actinoplanes lobatus]|uniref:DUF3592 domain-containing protein n=1 Tax=Actinoplanes lobatus TaxID=113568 RepID=A0ABQ4ALX9_9ACTN|nr:hypothetical protein GCM10010112_39360 [Actinoplanes lobatus]GIE41820.1 hypothetical protein Alo02nite_47180 [Actinoplanes lobatus]
MAGAALAWLPLHTQSELDDWAAELWTTGTPATATVRDRITREGGNRSSDDTTMYVRYELDGRLHEAEVACFEVCLPVGATVPIRVSAADPADFVTDFGQLSGHRGETQGVLGVIGLFLLIAGISWSVKLVRARPRPRRRPAAPQRPVALRSKHKPGR